jgi:hypothetical protein
MDLQEVVEIMEYLSQSGAIFDKSAYKYGIYKKVLARKYKDYSDYKLKKIFDSLLEYKFLSKVECFKSFKYRFHSITNEFKIKIKEEKKKRDTEPIILTFD